LRIPPWGFKVVHGIGGGIAENSGSEAALLKAVRIIHKARLVGGYIFIGLSPLMFLNAVYARISQANTLGTEFGGYVGVPWIAGFWVFVISSFLGFAMREPESSKGHLSGAEGYSRAPRYLRWTGAVVFLASILAIIFFIRGRVGLPVTPISELLLLIFLGGIFGGSSLFVLGCLMQANRNQ
jgi:hypothetical protein